MANAVMEMVKPVLKPVRLGYLNTRQSITGSSVSLMNYAYTAIRSTTMSMFTPSGFSQENNDPRAEELKKNCYVTLPNFYDPQLIREVQGQFDRAISDDDLVTGSSYTRILKSTPNVDQLIPSIFKLLRNQELIKIVQSFYKSPFTLTLLSATRLFPVPEKDRTPALLQSGIWHCDDIPTDTVHLVVYLHDVTPQHGPTRLVSKTRTKELMRMGYGRRWEIGIPESVLEDRNYVKDLSCKIGTAHLMLPCLSLHRAGIPEEGLIRDSLFFSFRPGLEPKQHQRLSPIKRKLYPGLQRIGESWLHPSSPVFGGRDIIYS